MLPFFDVQLHVPTHIMHEQKLYFIVYNSVSLFSKRSVYTRSFKNLNKVGVRVTIDS